MGVLLSVCREELCAGVTGGEECSMPLLSRHLSDIDTFCMAKGGACSEYGCLWKAYFHLIRSGTYGCLGGLADVVVGLVTGTLILMTILPLVVVAVAFTWIAARSAYKWVCVCD